LRLTLRHELAHVRRGDAWQRLAFACLRAAHWFNPLVWLAAKHVSADQELACDRMTLRDTDASTRQTYGRLLLRLASPTGTPMPSFVPAMAARRATVRQLQHRLVMTHDPRRPSRLVALAAALPLAGAAIAGVLTLTARPAIADAQETRPTDQRATIVLEEVTTPADLAIMRRLDDVFVGTVEFDQTPLTDVFDTLLFEAEINAFINWGSFEITGLDPTMPVTLGPLTDLPRGRVLDLVLKSVGEGFGDFGYAVEDGVLIVAEAGSLPMDARLARRVFELDSTMFGEDVPDAIRTFVEPDRWSGPVGAAPSVRLIGSKLIVRHQPDVLVKIEDFLREIDALAPAVEEAERINRATELRQQLVELEQALDIERQRFGEEARTVVELRQMLNPVRAELTALRNTGVAVGVEIDPNKLWVGELITVGIIDLPQPGQVLRITKRIRDDGAIVLPYAGAVEVAGVTSQEASDAIYRALVDAGAIEYETAAAVITARPGLGETISDIESATSP
ncbi:MAG: M56 family metallopeptidase, partial [Planctomycetota bacterium]